MSFGFSIGDFVLLTQLASRVVNGAREACGAYDELTREVTSLHLVLGALEREVDKSDSILNSEDDDRENELQKLVQNCEKALGVLERILEKYNGLTAEKRGIIKFYKKVKFGSGEMVDLSKLRHELATHTNAITIYLNCLSLGSQGKVERHMHTHSESLRGLKESVNWITASLQAKGCHGEGSILTAYTNDERGFWKDLRRELLRDGYSSHKLEKHKKTIQAYIQEHGDRGVLDEIPTSQDLSTSDIDDVEPDVLAWTIETLSYTVPTSTNDPPNGSPASAPVYPEEVTVINDINFSISYPAANSVPEGHIPGLVVLYDAPLGRYDVSLDPSTSKSRKWPFERALKYVIDCESHAPYAPIWNTFSLATTEVMEYHKIPRGYNVSRWDPECRFMVLMGNVFDYMSFAGWVYDLHVQFYGHLSDETREWLVIWDALGKVYSAVYYQDRLQHRSYDFHEAQYSPFFIEANSILGEFALVVFNSMERTLRPHDSSPIRTREDILEFVNNLRSHQVENSDSPPPTISRWKFNAQNWSGHHSHRWKRIFPHVTGSLSSASRGKPA